MRVIYEDILLALNLAINYLLLFAAARISGMEFTGKRVLIGAAVGAAYSLVVLTELPDAVLMLSKLAVLGITLFITFGRKTIAEFLRLAAFFTAGDLYSRG